MKILVLNGSPKGEKSNTMCLTNAFLEGIYQTKKAEIAIINISKKNIKPCLGCFSCWNKTPGKCCLKDDMEEIISKMLWADVIVWSFPLYYFGIPSAMKGLMERQLPMNLPFMVQDNANGGAHPSRYDLSGKEYVVISTCGFYTAEGNYDGVDFIFDKLLGRNNYEKIYCGQGELFRVAELKKRTDEYLKIVKTAGTEFADAGVSAVTKQELTRLLYSREIFERMADASWGVEKSGDSVGQKDHRKAFAFTTQMAALYNKAAYGGKDLVLEMYFTDCNERYQILLAKECSEVLEDNFLKFTTKIETPLTLWQEIAQGVMDGKTALMEKKYRVEGDFRLMLQWDDFFGVPQRDGEKTEESHKKTNMGLLLLPWLSIWVVMSIHERAGAVLGILSAIGLLFAQFRFRLTFYECTSALVISGVGLLSFLGVEGNVLILLSYLLFGLLWTATVFRKIPLTARYSMHGYGGEKAFENPLFLRTNRILTACWGGVYLITPIWTYAIMQTSYPWLVAVVNVIVPALVGIFTVWFQKWYPAYYASK